MSSGFHHYDLVDQTLDGRYRVLRLIAQGGMSAVYEGEQLNVSRRVAIKILKPEISHDPDMLARFRAEARIISELRHPNTLKLIDYGSTPEGLLFLVTELLSGEPLALRLKRGPMTARETLHVIREVLRSLKEAHERDVIHRDLKPGNLFLEEVAGQTVVKVLDFGIAKMKSKAAGDPEQPTTADGLLLGTPAYLSPEQAAGKGLDARSDIYSLGAVAFHCLSGQIPFPGEPVAQIMAHVSRPPPRFEELDLSTPVPEQLAELVYRWMAKKPTQRPANAQAALEEATDVHHELFGGERSTSAPDVYPRSRAPRRGARGMWMFVVALVFVGTVVVLGQRAVDRGWSDAPDASVIFAPPVGEDIGLRADDGGPTGDGDGGQANADLDAEITDADATTEIEPGLRVLRRPITGSWRSQDEVLAVLSRIEPLALDCFRRTVTEDREITLIFIVRTAGVSVRVEPQDEQGRAFRRCLSFRLPSSLRWPRRADVSTAGLVIGERGAFD